MSPTNWTLLAILSSLIFYFYLKLKEKYKYWSKRGVVNPKPLPILGNLLSVATGRHSAGALYCEIYKKYPNERIVGIYEIVEPVLVIRDAELIEKVLVKDFQYFSDHPMFGTDDSLFSTALFNLKGKHWRSVRYKISPTFTTGKLKGMFPQLMQCGDYMIKRLKDNRNDCNFKTLISSYSLDVVATSVFGIEIKEEKIKREFAEMSQLLFYSGVFMYISQVLINLFPNFSKLLKLRFFPVESEEYFKNLIATTFHQRQSLNIQRNDYINCLLKLKEKGTMEVIEKDVDDNFLRIEDNEELESIEFSEKLLCGQAVQFLLGGFDPVVTSSIYTMYELAVNQNFQEKARNQILAVLGKNGYSYSAIREMTFLDQCIHETLRLHSITLFLMRLCTKNYTTSEGVEIERGTRIMIPIQAINEDPQYFPDPQVYNPERFDPENTVPSAFVPFGVGPRMCIGMRFALVELKLALVKVLANFRFTLSSKTKLPLETKKLTFTKVLKTDVLFNFTPLEL